jgi:hypothetical protein
VFLIDYRNVSGDLYARLLRDISEPRLERVFIYEGDDAPMGPLTLEGFVGKREFKPFKDILHMNFGDERVSPKKPDSTAKLFKERLIKSQNDTAGEILERLEFLSMQGETIKEIC